MASNHMDMDHEQSTVGSPRVEHEKYDTGATTGTTNGTTKKPNKAVQLFNICSDNPIVTYGIRFWQWCFGVVTLGLAAYSLARFYRSDTRMRLTTFTSCLTLVYLVIVFVLSFCYNSALISGPLMIMELLLMLLWLCSFVSATARFANVSCVRKYDGSRTSELNINQYSSNGRLRGCRTGKAACAFAAIMFLLFAISSFILFWNVIRPLIKRRRSAQIFKSHKSGGAQLNKCGLAFSKYYNQDEAYDAQSETTAGYAGTAGYNGSGDGVNEPVPAVPAGTGTAGTGTAGGTGYNQDTRAYP